MTLTLCIVCVSVARGKVSVRIYVVLCTSCALVFIFLCSLFFLPNPVAVNFLSMGCLGSSTKIASHICVSAAPLIYISLAVLAVAASAAYSRHFDNTLNSIRTLSAVQRSRVYFRYTLKREGERESAARGNEFFCVLRERVRRILIA